MKHVGHFGALNYPNHLVIYRLISRKIFHPLNHCDVANETVTCSKDLPDYLEFCTYVLALKPHSKLSLSSGC